VPARPWPELGIESVRPAASPAGAFVRTLALTDPQGAQDYDCAGAPPRRPLDGLIMVVDAIRLMLFPAIMAFAASSDLLTMTISNRVSLILAGGFLVLALISGMGWWDLLLHIGAAGVVLVIAFGFFTQGWIGGGDAKLAAATALWLGFDHLLPYLVYASLFGGALTLLLIQFRLAPLPGVLAQQEWVQRLHKKDGGVPYGIALAAAALAVYPETPWMAALGM
jgi:prepilin peptidase CpaA